ncbi:MAG: division/cell wall cluster transcriptional repressor MraZ [Lachnospiraceae bacterium]|jgi:MraZ protein|nr:division/cell wall cluster transcriptional repressor MraZ [Lachnospiraceae bacterium]
MEGSFNGIYRHTLDAKGRLSVPSRFRDILGSRFMIGEGTDDCLLIYTMDDWKLFMDKLKSLPTNTNEDAIELIRYYGSRTLEVEIDRQGRIILPQQLRKAAGIDRNVVFVGRIDRAELWDEAAFDAHEAAVTKKDIKAAAKRLFESGYQF